MGWLFPGRANRSFSLGVNAKLVHDCRRAGSRHKGFRQRRNDRVGAKLPRQHLAQSSHSPPEQLPQNPKFRDRLAALNFKGNFCRKSHVRKSNLRD